ncbi:CDP-alcohol phosphatidyltransferase family protein [Candidatus Woesearchaeota archaeon]|nr:CDP-alcohol phosphatidyltransferase family protein [Candidatus Woesearchaeota archaeon]MBW3006426.1 CDP-alcohol phosphatidyltransferase family protein [Candidatus Woesearchaeota archaeon]
MKKICNIPNTLSILRLVFGALIILQFDSTIKYVYLIIAILLDALDGFVARKLNQVTKLGGIIDPAVDKIFVLMLFVFIYLRLELPAYYIIFFFIRDIFTVIAWLFVLNNGKSKKLEAKARFPGKIVTALQFLTLVFMVMENLLLIKIGMYAILFAAVISILDYIIYYRRKNA